MQTSQSLNMSRFHSSKYSKKKQQRWQASHHVWLLLSAAASVHLGGKELSVVRPCPFVILNTTPLLFVPTAPPASLCQMDIPASALWGLQGSTARKVANLSAVAASFCLFFIHLRTHMFTYSALLFSCSRVHQRSILQLQPVIMDVVPPHEYQAQNRGAAAVSASIIRWHPPLLCTASQCQSW